MKIDGLTDQEKRVKIAEACPFVDRHNPEEPRYWDQNGNFVEFDPLFDLNAMHEAEKTIRHDPVHPTRWSIYCYHLAELCENLYDSIHATASQRADAFLSMI